MSMTKRIWEAETIRDDVKKWPMMYDVHSFGLNETFSLFKTIETPLGGRPEEAVAALKAFAPRAENIQFVGAPVFGPSCSLPPVMSAEYAERVRKAAIA